MIDDGSTATDTVPIEDGNRFGSMSTLKRWIAIGAGAAIALGVLAVIATLAFAVRESGNGADPDEAFSATELVPESLGASVSWSEDAADLARVVEPMTRNDLEAAWLRANDASMRAADGDIGGLDVWFTGPALTAAGDRFGPPADGAPQAAVGSSVATAHELNVDFYSLDGQIVVLQAASTVPDTDESTGAEVSSTVRSEVILVLSDGNWRIRNIERRADER